MTTPKQERDDLARTYAAIGATQIVDTLMFIKRAEWRHMSDERAMLLVDLADEMLNRMAESIGEMISQEEDSSAVEALTLIANRLSPEKA